MCDTMVVVGDGQVLFAKNSDRDPNEAQLLDWQPARDHAPGTTVRCTYLEIPQAPHTHAVLLSRPFWMWGAEMGANEHGVVIGNEAVFTREPYAKTGLTGMDLLRLALERAVTAKDAVSMLTDLLEAHGQGGGCGHEHRAFTYHNSFLVADPYEAYVLETAGRQWAVEHVSSGVRTISNGLTIPGFAEQHADRLRSRVSACRTRQALTTALAGRGADADGLAAGGLSGSTALAPLLAVLRAHGPEAGAEPRYSVVNGAMSAPCMHAGGRLASSQTTASWAARLTPAGAQHWVTGTAAPCTGLFKPVSVTEPLRLGPEPTDRYDPRTLWWRHERLHRWVLADPQRRRASYRAERDAVERRWLQEPPSPAEAFAEGDRLLARWLQGAAAPGGDVRPPWVRRYWQVRAARAGLT